MFRNVCSFVALFALVMSAPVFAQAAKQAPSRAASRATAKPAVTTPININTANAGELDNLPGIGAKTAARIIEYRQKNGPFKKVEELMNVRGVGEKNFLKLKEQITVTPLKADHTNQQ